MLEHEVWVEGGLWCRASGLTREHSQRNLLHDSGFEVAAKARAPRVAETCEAWCSGSSGHPHGSGVLSVLHQELDREGEGLKDSLQGGSLLSWGLPLHQVEVWNFFRGGKNMLPPALKGISIRNCVTTATFSRIAILQLLGKRYQGRTHGPVTTSSDMNRSPSWNWSLPPMQLISRFILITSSRPLPVFRPLSPPLRLSSCSCESAQNFTEASRLFWSLSQMTSSRGSIGLPPPSRLLLVRSRARSGEVGREVKRPAVRAQDQSGLLSPETPAPAGSAGGVQLVHPQLWAICQEVIAFSHFSEIFYNFNRIICILSGLIFQLGFSWLFFLSNNCYPLSNNNISSSILIFLAFSFLVINCSASLVKVFGWIR